MDVGQIRRLGRALPRFLSEFGDCFGRSDTRAHLKVYVKGQISDLHRKSVEPMALRAGVAPRSLQAFLGLASWDEDRLVDRLQHIVVRDHAHPWAIGIVDETGMRKDGRHTACVQRQWCGSVGKIENSVVSVHTGYAVGAFHAVLDSDLFVPKGWADDPAKRREVGMPDEVTHRSKPKIALRQIERALANGIRVAAWTFDEHYGQSYAFLDGLDRLGQTYVAEVPCTFCGWIKEPAILHRRTPQEMRQPGTKRGSPRLSKTAAPVSEVRNLLNHSPVFVRQKWTPIHIKNGEKGAIVRDVKSVRLHMQRDGLPTRPHWLIVTRHPQSGELKFFVSNAPGGTPLEWLLWVADSRWPIEQCFREQKDELGFDHFEVRGWQSIHRHLHLSQVSHLFVNRMRQTLAAEESARQAAKATEQDENTAVMHGATPVDEATNSEPDQGRAGSFSPWGARQSAVCISTGKPDGGSDSLRTLAMAAGPAPWPSRRPHHPSRRRGGDRLSPPSQRRRQGQSHENNKTATVKNRNRSRPNQILFG